MKYYGVVVDYYDNGHREARIITDEADEKPSNMHREFTDCDEYTYWFDDAKEAQRFYESYM